MRFLRLALFELEGFAAPSHKSSISPTGNQSVIPSFHARVSRFTFPAASCFCTLDAEYGPVLAPSFSKYQVFPLGIGTLPRTLER